MLTKQIQYLELIQGKVSQSAVEFSVVLRLLGVMQSRRTQRQGLQVVVFCHLVLLQAVVNCSQTMIGSPLILTHS